MLSHVVLWHRQRCVGHPAPARTIALLWMWVAVVCPWRSETRAEICARLRGRNGALL